MISLPDALAFRSSHPLEFTTLDTTLYCTSNITLGNIVPRGGGCFIEIDQASHAAILTLFYTPGQSVDLKKIKAYFKDWTQDQALSYYRNRGAQTAGGGVAVPLSTIIGNKCATSAEIAIIVAYLTQILYHVSYYVIGIVDTSANENARAHAWCITYTAGQYYLMDAALGICDVIVGLSDEGKSCDIRLFHQENLKIYYSFGPLMGN